MREITKKLGELEIGDTIVEDDRIYMVMAVTFSDDDMHVTIGVGYPRPWAKPENRLTAFTAFTSRPVTVLI